MEEAEDKLGKKGRTNAALTLGIIGTALGAFANNGGCGCGNNGGILRWTLWRKQQLLRYASC